MLAKLTSSVTCSHYVGQWARSSGCVQSNTYRMLPKAFGEAHVTHMGLHCAYLEKRHYCQKSDEEAIIRLIQFYTLYELQCGRPLQATQLHELQHAFIGFQF